MSASGDALVLAWQHNRHLYGYPAYINCQTCGHDWLMHQTSRFEGPCGGRDCPCSRYSCDPMAGLLEEIRHGEALHVRPPQG